MHRLEMSAVETQPMLPPSLSVTQNGDVTISYENSKQKEAEKEKEEKTTEVIEISQLTQETAGKGGGEGEGEGEGGPVCVTVCGEFGEGEVKNEVCVTVCSGEKGEEKEGTKELVEINLPNGKPSSASKLIITLVG